MTDLSVIVYNNEPYEWRPEDYGFECIIKSPDSLECIWKKGPYELRYRPNSAGPFWLCRKTVKDSNPKSNISGKIVVNFSKPIYPSDKEFASMLLDKRL